MSQHEKLREHMGDAIWALLNYSKRKQNIH